MQFVHCCSCSVFTANRYREQNICNYARKIWKQLINMLFMKGGYFVNKKKNYKLQVFELKKNFRQLVWLVCPNFWRANFGGYMPPVGSHETDLVGFWKPSDVIRTLNPPTLSVPPYLRLGSARRDTHSCTWSPRCAWASAAWRTAPTVPRWTTAMAAPPRTGSCATTPARRWPGTFTSAPLSISYEPTGAPEVSAQSVRSSRRAKS